MLNPFYEFINSGGESGIRTHARITTPIGFQDRTLQPLGYLSKSAGKNPDININVSIRKLTPQSYLNLLIVSKISLRLMELLVLPRVAIPILKILDKQD